MGQDFPNVDGGHFHKKDYTQFNFNLQRETRQLQDWHDSHQLWDEADSTAMTVGVELEAWLVHSTTYQPSCACEAVLEALHDPHCTRELGKFQLEYNSPVFSLTGLVLSEMQRVLQEFWDRASATALERCETRLVAMGTLPTLMPKHLSLDNMSPCNRFRALNTQLLHLRKGEAVHIQIREARGDRDQNQKASSESSEPTHGRNGKSPSEHDGTGKSKSNTSTCVQLDHGNVMMEAACCSFQIHWKIPASRSARYWNAALAVSPLLLAVGANSPTLFGRTLWSETRVPCFEQAVCYDRCRVGLPRYCQGESLMEYFRENLGCTPLLPLRLPVGEANDCPHLRLQNGSRWQWLRPVLGFADDERVPPGGPLVPHFRMELRCLPSGPTIVDSVANCALFFGLVEYLVSLEEPVERILPYAFVESNFYGAAQRGFDASITWLQDPVRGGGGRDQDYTKQCSALITAPAAVVLLRVLPLARLGLERLGVDAADVTHYLHILEQRVKNGQTGAMWQMSWLRQHPSEDMAHMVGAYLSHQTSGDQVAHWTVEVGTVKVKCSDVPCSQNT